MNTDLKIGICAAKYVGYELVKFCLEHRFPIEFVNVVKDEIYSEKIMDICLKNKVDILNVNPNSEIFKSELNNRNIDIVLLLWFPTIIKKNIIDSVNIGFINLHPSLLPYNRGMHPWYWNFIEETPAGVTIHFINDKIDEGDILWQKEIKKDYTYTGEVLYKKCEKEIINLFKKNYENIINYNFNPIKQNKINSTFHLKKELDIHSHIDLNKKYKAKDFINIIRARTFWKGKSSFFYDENGDKYNIRVKIEKENG